jgi:serine/threonine protein kinase
MERIYTHITGRWHGDLKPENILFCEGSWKIADPGYAKLVSKEHASHDGKGFPVISLRGGTDTYGEKIRYSLGKKVLISYRST